MMNRSLTSSSFIFFVVVSLPLFFCFILYYYNLLDFPNRHVLLHHRPQTLRFTPVIAQGGGKQKKKVTRGTSEGGDEEVPLEPQPVEVHTAQWTCDDALIVTSQTVHGGPMCPIAMQYKPGGAINEVS